MVEKETVKEKLSEQDKFFIKWEKDINKKLKEAGYNITFREYMNALIENKLTLVSHGEVKMNLLTGEKETVNMETKLYKIKERKIK